jgi:glycoprotein endo-alpha-1,2-mannosidase
MCNPPLSFKRWFRKANIGLLVTSWWGPDRIEDTNTLEVIMEHEHIGNLKIALHYETTGRIKDGKNMTVPRSDIQYMCENYFDHPNYYKIDGRPVVVMYISRKLEKDGILVEALLTMKSEAAKCGQNLFLIGDAVFAKAPDQDEPFISFSYFDAVTNYDVYC